MKIPFDNHYIDLGQRFYVKTKPETPLKPALIQFNQALANSLGFSATESDEAEIVGIFSGATVPTGAAPVAMAYAGHQFGNFVPQLGDGRALLLGEVTTHDGANYGIHFKGSGQTAFSRNGDGRAALGPVLREYLLSEAMAKLNIPTTRALAAVTTGEEVARERLLPGAIITRVARSFVRVGSFEYFRVRDDVQAIQTLADYVIRHNYPDLAAADNSYVALLQAVSDRQAGLIAQWMSVGFIHGVMNTDNMAVSGETIDYGPCAFMDGYAHQQVFSSIDRGGRYAYANQPAIGLWNLTRFAECLLPLFADNTDAAVEIAQAVLQTYITTYEDNWLQRMRAKCGLTAGTAEEDKALIEDLFEIMHANHADFTLTFLYLSGLTSRTSEQDNECRDLFANPSQFDAWAARWRQRLSHETRGDAERARAMRAVNPVYIPRNHQVEAAIKAAEEHGDFSAFYALHEVLSQPYERQQGKNHYQMPPEAHEIVHKTFCGT
jgi:uncharacterized protein YdiU (UPF0061 family)